MCKCGHAPRTASAHVTSSKTWRQRIEGAGLAVVILLHWLQRHVT